MSTFMDLDYIQTLFYRKLAPEKILITSSCYCELRNIIFGGLSNGCIVAWDLCINLPVARVCVFNGHQGPITSMVWHTKSNLLITGGLDQNVRLWDIIFSDLVDVSGVQQLKIDDVFKDDIFYVAHGGTVNSLVSNSDTTNQQIAKKSSLIQAIHDHNRQITKILQIGNNFITMAQDGLVILYIRDNSSSKQGFKFTKFQSVYKLNLGFEKPDSIRYMEAIQLSKNKGQIHGSAQVQIPKITQQSNQSYELFTEGQNLTAARVYGQSIIASQDDGNIFIGDSLGEIHCLSIIQEKIQYVYKLSDVHRLTINQQLYLGRENSIVSCSQDGTCRSLVAVTGQVYFTYFNQRVRPFLNMCSVRNEEQDIKISTEQPAKEDLVQKKKQDEQNRAAYGNVITSNALDNPDTNIKRDNMILLTDQDHYITVLDAVQGQLLLDLPMADIVPNEYIIQKTLEQYNIDTSLPIACDFRSSKNAFLYAIQKQNTTISDEYKMLKLNYNRTMNSTQDTFLEHQNLNLYQDPTVVSVFSSKIDNQQRIIFVRSYCVDIFKPKFKTSTTQLKLQKPVRMIALQLMSIQQKEVAEMKTKQSGRALSQLQTNKLNSSKAFSKQLFRSISPQLGLSTKETDGSSFVSFMNEYRYQQVALKKMNNPLEQLRVISPYLAQDLDSVESMISNNMDPNGNLPLIKSPNRGGVVQNVQQMMVPFYVLSATEDNIINNYDPRVIRKPYHTYKIDFNTIRNAFIFDYSQETGISVKYRKLETGDERQVDLDPHQYINKGVLPPIQAMPRDDNIYNRLTKGLDRNGKGSSRFQNQVRRIDTKKESQYKFYHTHNNEGVDNQLNLGLYDQDLIYNVVEDADSNKIDINKMNLEVKKVSELPDTYYFDCMIDTLSQFKKDVLAFGHEDGSISMIDLQSNQMARVFGGHSFPITSIQHSTTVSGFQIVSLSSDSRLFCTQIPLITQFRVQFSCSTIFKEDSISAISITPHNHLLLGGQMGSLYLCFLPLQTTLKHYTLFEGQSFFTFFSEQFPIREMISQDKSIKINKFNIHSMELIDNHLVILYDQGYLLVFRDIIKDLLNWQDSIRLNTEIAQITSSDKKKFESYVKSCKQFTLLPDIVFNVLDNQTELITCLKLAAPLTKAKQIIESFVLKKANHCQNQLSDELYDDEIRNRTQVKKQEIEEMQERKTQKLSTMSGRYLDSSKQIKLKQLLNKNQDIVIDNKDLVDIGTECYIMVGYSSGKMKIFSFLGEILNSYKYNSAVTSLASINRGPIGERILNQLIITGLDEHLLRNLWVGLLDGQIQNDQCELFVK